jgi:dynein heavy chain
MSPAFSHAPAVVTRSLVVAFLSQVLFADFQTTDPEAQRYEEVADQKKLLATIEEYLVDYNSQSKNRMDLVLFLYAAEHICRISRVIKQPYGNCLLVGVGGSGRQSLTRIATFMADFEPFSIEISKNYTANEWREDLKTVLRKAGAEGVNTTFIFSDTQLKEESFLEDINNILNTGEVPNLFPKDELFSIIEQVRRRRRKRVFWGRPPLKQNIQLLMMCT